MSRRATTARARLAAVHDVERLAINFATATEPNLSHAVTELYRIARALVAAGAP